MNKPGEQLIELPLAIADNAGNLQKGQKSYTTRFLESWYKNAFFTQLPYKPECSILEGMFLINTVLLGSHKTMSDYGRFLFTRFIQTQFKHGCFEVHVIFDNSGRVANTPRYKSASLSNEHCCDPVTNTMKQ